MPVVDLRFVVHDKADIDLATKSLVAFNKVSLSRQKNYDAEASAAKRGMTATTKLLSLDRKLTTQRKIEKQMVEEGLMSKKEQIALSERYDRILDQETRTLQDYIDTDRVLQREQKAAAKSEEALAKQRTKTKNETEKLRRTYDSTYAATKRYKQGLKDIDRAFEGMEDGPERASRAIKALKSDYQAFIAASKSGGVVNAGNQFARYGDQAYRAQQRTKRFASVGLQQAGYQVNDFIVQIASGQNALVAFGQQGSQLAGIFGTAGAVVGALIAAAAAIGNLIWQYYQTKEGVEDLSESLKKLPDLYSSIDSMSDSLANGLTEPWHEGERAVRSYIQATRDADFARTGETFKRQINAVEGWWDSISRVLFGKENVTGLATAIRTEIDRATEEIRLVELNKGSGRELSKLDVPKEKKRVGGLETLEAELQTLFDGTEKLEDRIEKIAKLREKYSPKGSKPDASVTKELDILIKAAGYHELILSYYDDLADAEQKRVDALGALVLKTAKMNEVTETNGAREALIAKQKREAEDEFQKLKREGVDLTKIETMNALDALDTAHEAALAKFDALADEKERLKVAKAVAKAEKDADDQLEKALKSAQAIVDQQAKVYKTEKDRLDTQRDKNELLRIEEEHGKKSEQALDQRIIAAQNLVSIRMTEKFLANGITDAEAALIAEAIQVAEQGVRFADSLQRSLEKTRLMNTEISKMQGLINGLIDFGSGVEKKLAKAVAVGKALREGTNTAVAGTISDQRFEAQKLLDAAKAQALKLPIEMQKGALKTAQDYYDADLKNLKLLEGQLLVNAKLAESQKEPKKAPKEKKDPLVELQNRLNLQTDLLGMTEAQGQVYKALGDKYSEVDREVIKSLESQIEYNKMVEFGTNQLADGLTSIVDGTKSVKDAFKDMARELVAQLYKVYVMERMVASIGGYIGGMGSVGSVHANGNVFNSGSLVPYANGGIVAGPTTFPMSGGKTGLMGEAGPEAIMPLKRGKNGKLGVQAEGGSGDVIIHQNFNFTANGDESVKKIIAQQAPAIANMTKKQILDDRRRGGQMKQAFG